MSLKRVGFFAALTVLAAAGIVSILVEREAAPAETWVGSETRGEALVLYHPSRDAGFSDVLAQAVVRGFRTAGFRVALVTTTKQARSDLRRFAIVAIVANTYYWSPDRPTLSYLRRVSLIGKSVIGIMAGAGSTAAAERKLGEAIRGAGAAQVETRSVWLFRPNDEAAGLGDSTDTGHPGRAR
jgi:hypothetical protein